MWHDDQLDRLAAYVMVVFNHANECVCVCAFMQISTPIDVIIIKMERNIGEIYQLVFYALRCFVPFYFFVYIVRLLSNISSRQFSLHIWVYEYMHITMFYPRNVGRYWHFDSPWKSICNASNRIPIVGSVMCVHNLKIGLFAAIAVAFVYFIRCVCAMAIRLFRYCLPASKHYCR